MKITLSEYNAAEQRNREITVQKMSGERDFHALGRLFSNSSDLDYSVRAVYAVDGSLVQTLEVFNIFSGHLTYMAWQEVPRVEKLRLTLVPDQFNNVGRRCCYGRSERNWRVRNALTDQNKRRYYLIANEATRQTRIVPVDRMHYLY